MKRLIIIILLALTVSAANNVCANSGVVASDGKTENQSVLINLVMHVFPEGTTVKIGNNEYQAKNGILNVQLPRGKYKCTYEAKNHKKRSNVLYLGAHIAGRMDGGDVELREKSRADSLYAIFEKDGQLLWNLFTNVPFFISLEPKSSTTHAVTVITEAGEAVARVDADFAKYVRLPRRWSLSSKQHEFFITHSRSKKPFYVFANIDKDTTIVVSVPDSLKLTPIDVRVTTKDGKSVSVSCIELSSGGKLLTRENKDIGMTPIVKKFYPGNYLLYYEMDSVKYTKVMSVPDENASHIDSVINVCLDKSERMVSESEQVFDVVKQMPAYPGGDGALFEYLSNNIKYPKDAEKQGIQGRVIVRFVVEKDGSVSDVKIVRSIHPLLNKEAIRVIQLMPKWYPGMQNGKPVRTNYTVPVMFRLASVKRR